MNAKFLVVMVGFICLLFILNSVSYAQVNDKQVLTQKQRLVVTIVAFIAQIETILLCPLLFIVGEKAVSAYFSEDAYSKAVEPKELFVVPGASHVDLYDVPEYMNPSLSKLDSFFKQYL